MAFTGLTFLLVAVLLFVAMCYLHVLDKRSGCYQQASDQVDQSLGDEQQMRQFWKILSEDPEHAVRDGWIGVCMLGALMFMAIGIAFLCICYVR